MNDETFMRRVDFGSLRHSVSIMTWAGGDRSCAGYTTCGVQFYDTKWVDRSHTLTCIECAWAEYSWTTFPL